MEGGNNLKEKSAIAIERDDYYRESLRTDREESWTKRRRRMINERIAISRSLIPPKQNKITNYFAPEDPEDEPIEVESLKDEENQEDSGKKTYPRVDQHYKKAKRKYKRKCCIVIPGPTIKKIANSLGASTARRWGTLNPIVGKERLIGYTGNPRKGVIKKIKT